MDHDANDPSSAFPFALSPEEHCANPVTSAATALSELQALAAPLDPAQMEKALRRQVRQVENNDFGNLEAMLVVQAQLLHRLFTRTVGQYAQESALPESGFGHGLFALRSQDACRATIIALAELKKESQEAQVRTDLYIRNELMKGRSPFNSKASHYDMSEENMPGATFAEPWKRSAPFTPEGAEAANVERINQP